mgnify:CR=1 FL=1
MILIQWIIICSVIFSLFLLSLYWVKLYYMEKIEEIMKEYENIINLLEEDACLKE